MKGFLTPEFDSNSSFEDDVELERGARKESEEGKKLELEEETVGKDDFLASSNGMSRSSSSSISSTLSVGLGLESSLLLRLPSKLGPLGSK